MKRIHITQGPSSEDIIGVLEVPHDIAEKVAQRLGQGLVVPLERSTGTALCIGEPQVEKRLAVNDIELGLVDLRAKLIAIGCLETGAQDGARHEFYQRLIESAENLLSKVRAAG